MRLSASFCLLAVLPAFSLAVPLEKLPRAGTKIPLKRRAHFVQEDGVVNMSALVNHMALTTAKISQGISNYETNTGKPHSLADLLSTSLSSTVSSIESIFSKRATGSVSLTDDAAVMWTGNLTVGTPPQTFRIDFDTGSSDMFIPGPSCTTNCDGRTLFQTSGSSTASDMQKNFTLNFGDGSQVAGDQFSETVSIAGMTATNQTVGVASTYSSSFPTTMDGLVGLGFQQISVFNQPGLFQTLVNSKEVDSPVFSMKLTSSSSELFLGGTDPSAFTGSISYTPVTTQGYWQVSMDSLSVDVNSNNTVIQGSQNVPAIIDSGTTMILGDNATVSAFYAQVEGAQPIDGQAGMWAVPCEVVPSASLSFGGVNYTISPDTFVLGLTSQGSSDCVGGIAASSASFWVVGDVFLQNVYSVYDVGNSQVGFATLA